MTYTYLCQECNHKWDCSFAMNNRDVPLNDNCPQCDKLGSIKRIIDFAPRIAYQGAYTIQQRAGNGWNDVLTKIKKNSGKNASHIETK